MRTPSRFMPKYMPPPVGPAQKTLWIALALGLIAVAIYLTALHPLAVTAFVACIWYLARREMQKAQSRRLAVAATRGKEGICDFARSFDCREVDTWIVRAVFEELQEELGQSQPFPLRATDRFVEDLHIDLEELDMTHVPAIAARTGRSLERCKSNQYWGQVRTVSDLVHFFNEQPRQAGVLSTAKAVSSC
jgi:hypothetical protein